METREQAAVRAREYRKRKGEEIRVKDRNRWANKRKYDRLKVRLGDKKCVFCRVLLSSKFAGGKRMKRTKYCDDCWNNPDIRRMIKSLWVKRWYHKKHGLPEVKIEFPAYQDDI